MNAATASTEAGTITIDDVVVTASAPAATCSDGIQNQGETGVDCGGPCGACGGGATNLWLEAECRVTSTGAYGTTYTATSGYSGTGYIESIANTTAVTPPTGQDRATYTVNAAAAGAHKVWFRINNNNTGDDNSWYFRVGTGSWITLNGIVPAQVGWVWAKSTTDVTLAAGNNTIEVANRENGLKIDKLYVTSTTTTPSGSGSAGTNCP
jgi:hypothetical protein